MSLGFRAWSTAGLFLGTRHIYTTTGFGPRKNMQMAGVYHFLAYMQTAQNTTLSIYITTGARCAPVGVYIQTGVFGAVCIYTKKWNTPAIFLFFSRPKPGGGVTPKMFSESGLPGGQNLSGPCRSILRYTRACQRPYNAKSENDRKLII